MDYTKYVLQEESILDVGGSTGRIRSGLGVTRCH